MESLKIIDTGVLTVKDIDKLKEFPKETGINRMIDKGNVNRIKSSMEQLYIPSVIKVNQDWYILDGQHSKQALMGLAEENEGLEIVYVMIDTEGRDREACILLNTTSKKWNYDDFLESYIQDGNDNYIWFKEFKEKYDLAFATAMLMVTCVNGGGMKNVGTGKIFMNGGMVITEERRIIATKLAEMLQEVKSLIPIKVGNTRSFQNAFVKIALNFKYDHRRMIDKLEYQYDRVYKCSTETGYAEMLEDIYNYKSSTSNKVKFL